MRVLLILLATLATVGSAAARGPIDFDARVAGMKAIERVYWSHRTWPAANPARKPNLEAVLSDSVVRQAAHDVLDRSVALEQRLGIRITSAMLQTEVERMARETRNASMLRELFEALDNDPRLIAECLARPIVVDRLMTKAGTLDAAPVDAPSFVSDSADLGPVPEFAPSSPCTPDTWSGPLQKVASRRMRHSAVWTGTEMIVFGGTFGGNSTTALNSGGRYCATACTPLTWYRDLDGDGFGDGTFSASECTQPVGYVANGTDLCGNGTLGTQTGGATRAGRTCP